MPKPQSLSSSVKTSLETLNSFAPTLTLPPLPPTHNLTCAGSTEPHPARPLLHRHQPLPENRKVPINMETFCLVLPTPPPTLPPTSSSFPLRHVFCSFFSSLSTPLRKIVTLFMVNYQSNKIVRIMRQDVLKWYYK